MAAAFCASCGAPATPGGTFCSQCGAAYATPAHRPAAISPAPATAPPGANAGAPRVTQGMAVAALLLNILLIPGVGSLVGGRTREGVWQLAMLGIGFVLVFTIIGILIAIPLFIAAWIWGLVTGIQLLQEAGRTA